jgi:hypothetical protein
MKVLLLAALFGRASCATERYVPAVDAKADSALVAAGLPPLAVRKLTARLRLGLGKAIATTQKSGVPWWVFVGVSGLSSASWQ